MEIAPLRWCPSPGKQVKLGSPSKARFTLPEEPRIRKCLISWTKSDGRSCSSNNFKKDNFGSRPEITISELYSSPFSKVTPTARPFFTFTFFTGASVMISTPKCSAERAMAILTAPVPPRWNPQARKAPSMSPI